MKRAIVRKVAIPCTFAYCGRAHHAAWRVEIWRLKVPAVGYEELTAIISGGLLWTWEEALAAACKEVSNT